MFSVNGYYAAVIPKSIQSLINNQASTINRDGIQSRYFNILKI